MSCEEVFLKLLQEHGYRFTPQREVVLDIMHTINKPTTADSIYTKVHERFASVDISTIYRTLELLVEFGLVSTIDTGSRQILYEYRGTQSPHLHIVCRKCGKISSANIEEARGFEEKLMAEYGFLADLSEITIPGYCKDCQDSLQNN